MTKLGEGISGGNLVSGRKSFAFSMKALIEIAHG